MLAFLIGSLLVCSGLGGRIGLVSREGGVCVAVGGAITATFGALRMLRERKSDHAAGHAKDESTPAAPKA